MQEAMVQRDGDKSMAAIEDRVDIETFKLPIELPGKLWLNWNDESSVDK